MLRRLPTPETQIAGDTPRYISGCRTDPITNLDMTVSKKFHMGQGVELELRAEFFNASNHPNFGAPNTRYSSTSPGSFGLFQNASRTINGGTASWDSG